jgi:hypothetical protein
VTLILFPLHDNKKLAPQPLNLSYHTLTSFLERYIDLGAVQNLKDTMKDYIQNVVKELLTKDGLETNVF